MQQKPSFQEMILLGIRLGLKNLNDTDRDISRIHKIVVKEKNWVTEYGFHKMAAYTRSFPGVETQKLITYIGWSFYGNRGGLVPGILWAFFPFLIWAGLGLTGLWFDTHPLTKAFLGGVKPAVLAVLLAVWFTLVQMVQPSVKYYTGLLLSSVFLYGWLHFLDFVIPESNISFALIIFLTTIVCYVLPPVLLVLYATPGIPVSVKDQGKGEVSPWVVWIIAGVLLCIVIFYGQTILLPEGPGGGKVDLPALLWIGISLFVLTKQTLGSIPLILVSGIAGVVYSFINSGL